MFQLFLLVYGPGCMSWTDDLKSGALPTQTKHSLSKQPWHSTETTSRLLLLCLEKINECNRCCKHMYTDCNGSRHASRVNLYQLYSWWLSGQGTSESSVTHIFPPFLCSTAVHLAARVNFRPCQSLLCKNNVSLSTIMVDVSEGSIVYKSSTTFVKMWHCIIGVFLRHAKQLEKEKPFVKFWLQAKCQLCTYSDGKTLNRSIKLTATSSPWSSSSLEKSAAFFWSTCFKCNST